MTMTYLCSELRDPHHLLTFMVQISSIKKPVSVVQYPIFLCLGAELVLMDGRV